MILPLVVARLGITDIYFGTNSDPENEEELLTNFKFHRGERTITWEEYTKARDEYFIELSMPNLRDYRNKLLIESDWVMTPDNQATLVNLQEWLDYRQALRDLPQSSIQFIWKNGVLDFESMNIPKAPAIVRKTAEPSETDILRKRLADLEAIIAQLISSSQQSSEPTSTSQQSSESTP